MYFVHLSSTRSTCAQRFSRSGFFQLSRCTSYTWAHIKYPSSLCVCTRVYKHTPTHHPNTRKNRETYKTKPLSLPLSKHSLSRQQQALTMHPCNGRYWHPLSWTPTPKHPGFPVPVLVVQRSAYRSTTPCTTIIKAWLHILTSQSLYWLCHVCAPPQLTSTALHPEMHPRTQPQLESLDSDSNHATLPTYFNPTSNTLCTTPSRVSLALSILGRPASRGALTLGTHRVTRNQPLVIEYGIQNIEYRI